MGKVGRGFHTFTDAQLDFPIHTAACSSGNFRFRHLMNITIEYCGM